MLSWVVKVVPQPPEPPSKNTEDPKEGKADAAPPPAPVPPLVHEKKVTFEDECKQDAAKSEKPKQDAEAAAGNGPAPGMLTWISSALPQPTLPASQNRANSVAKEEAAAASKPNDERGMMAWISQGLEKVVPQPDLKSKESTAAEQQVQVQQTAAPAEPQKAKKEPDPTEQTAPPSMMEWIKHGIVKVVPQPEIPLKPEGTNQSETPAPPKAPPAAPPPATRPALETESAKEAEQQPNMMGWIVSGIGRMLPQPVPKPDAGNDDVQSISTTQKKTDLVLEDLEEVEDEPPVQNNQQRSTKETDDVETQVDELSPLVDSIKKEAGEAVLAHMEERLQQERLEAARVAEEMARKAAEEAVRQLEVEHSAKIVIETLPESNDQLPNILEEENEDEPELQNLQEDSEDSTGTKSKSTEENQTDECLVDVCPAEEDPDATTEGNQVEAPALSSELQPPDQVTPSSTDVEPASERRDLESPVTQQPEPHPEEAPPPSTQQNEAAAAEEETAAAGSGVPSLCAPVKNFLLRLPLAAECVERCRKLMHEHHLTPPALSMPTPPAELSGLPQQLAQLPQRARQLCSSVAGRFSLPSFLSSLNRSILQQRPPETP